MPINFNETQNKTVVNNVIDELKLNPITDSIPKTVVPTIQPTFEVKKKFCNVIRATNSGSTGSGTHFTTPSDRDYYLTGITLSYSKDATCDAATGAILVSVVIDGTTVSILGLPIITLTAQSDSISISFPTPIKLDRNSIIQMTTVTFTTGVLRRIITSIGYTEEAGNNLSV